MSRGIKGSGKAPTRKVAPKEKKEETKAAKVRKAYPSRDERIAMADKQIARLTKLNEDRAALIAKTEGTLAVRKAALEKSAAALKKELAKKERLTATPEKLKAEKKTKHAKLNELAGLLEASGKSVEEWLEAVKEKIEK